MWFHSGRRKWTKRIWKPLDWQMEAMMELFTTGSTEHATKAGQELHDKLPETSKVFADREFKQSQFPFFCDIDNPTRHDDWDAMKFHHIYRDPWERKLPEQKFMGCTVNSFDYPGLQVWVETVASSPGPSYDITPTSFAENIDGVRIEENNDADTNLNSNLEELNKRSPF